MSTEKEKLLFKGKVLMQQFCEINNIETPRLNVYSRAEWQFDTCGYYRPGNIHICPSKCAAPGRGGRAWSWPGYSVDRTPYGVVQHELGHHVDWLKGDDKGAYWSNYSSDMRKETGEPKLTNYCPNDAEWFAEIFRLFVTNPGMLQLMRPLTYQKLLDDGLVALFSNTWAERLGEMEAPERHLKAAYNKIK